MTYIIATLAGVLYLLPIVFTGIDVCDTGFYLTFYRNIFSDAPLVEYNFMYYLSGLIGGGIEAACPSLTLAGWRMIGVGIIVLSQLTVTLMLRRVVPLRSLIAGNAVITVALVGIPLVVCNDLIAALLYCVALTLIYKGVTGHNILLPAIAGVVIGVNIFARIPNIVAVVFAFTPFLYNRRDEFTLSFKQVAAIFFGAIVGIGLMLLTMMALGHLELFMHNMRDLMTIAADNDGGSSHSILSMIKTFGVFYFKMALYSAVLGLIVKLFNMTYASQLHKAIKVVIIIALMIAVMLVTQFLKTLDVVWMLSLWGCAYVWVKSRGNRALRLAAGLGVAMMLLFPLGSDGAYNNGAIIAFIALPIAMTAWLKNGRPLLIVAWGFVALFQMARVGAYFDGGMLWKKTAKVETAFTAGVGTTPQRATIINDCLSALRNNGVTRGDTMMVYGSAPLLNYLTDTKPAIGCSWPELLSADLLRHKLQVTDITPRYILRQHFITIGKDWSEPEADWHDHYAKQNSFLNDEKLQVLNKYMEKGKFTVVWENDYFTLYRRP